MQLWDYQAGAPICAGYGHAAVIVTCRYSPCGKFLVTGSADGAVFIWAVPKKYWPQNHDIFKEDAVPKKTASSASLTRKSSSTRNLKTPENIKELETSRSNKDSIICECPPVDMTCPPDINEQCVGAEENDAGEGIVAAGYV